MSEKIILKYDLRDEQQKMLDFTIESINNGNKYILINSPTGTGKSYAAILISKWYRENFGTNKNITILTGSKILQNQYINDFPFIKNLKGQSNYFCKRYNTDCRTGKELNKINKEKCQECSYDHAKNEWKYSFMSITNFHLFNIFSMFFTDMLTNKYGSLLIVDEAHDFENVFNNFLTVNLNLNILKKCGFSVKYMEYFRDELSKLKTIESTNDFINNTFIKDLYDIRKLYINDINISTDNVHKQILSGFINEITDQLYKFETFLLYYNSDKDNWVLDINKNKKTDMTSISIQPIWSYNYLKDRVWANFDHVVFLSGTILNKELFSYVNGLDEDITSYVEVDTSFPEENRLIYYLNNIGKMTYKEKSITFKNQISYINKILKKYKNDKGIIHTGNYEISEWLKEHSDSDRLIFHDVFDREEKLDIYIKSDKPLVIVSPSMGTGISLDDNLGRFGIVLKVPYPNITQPQIKHRIESNGEWYVWYTTTQIIQSLGRIVRSKDDYGENYILDASFSNILENGYIPQYIIDSIRLVKR